MTLTSTADGEWTVDVQWGAKRTLKSAPVAASAVSQASKLLPAEVDEAVESVLSAARERHLARVEQLRAELEAAPAGIGRAERLTWREHVLQRLDDCRSAIG